MKQAFRSARVRAERACTHRFCTQSNDRTHRQIEFLGRARFYADGRPGDVALRGEYALSGTDRAGRHAIHSGLRHGAARAGEPLGRAKQRESPGNTYPGYALSLGSYPGDSVFFAAVCGEQRISFLQLPIQISGARYPETGLRNADVTAL